MGAPASGRWVAAGSNYRDVGRRDSMALQRQDRTGLDWRRHATNALIFYDPRALTHARPLPVRRLPFSLRCRPPFPISPRPLNGGRSPTRACKSRSFAAPVGSHIDTIEDSSRARSERHAQCMVNGERYRGAGRRAV